MVNWFLMRKENFKKADKRNALISVNDLFWSTFVQLVLSMCWKINSVIIFFTSYYLYVADERRLNIMAELAFCMITHSKLLWVITCRNSQLMERTYLKWILLKSFILFLLNSFIKFNIYLMKTDGEKYNNVVVDFFYKLYALFFTWSYIGILIVWW